MWCDSVDTDDVHTYFGYIQGYKYTVTNSIFNIQRIYTSPVSVPFQIKFLKRYETACFLRIISSHRYFGPVAFYYKQTKYSMKTMFFFLNFQDHVRHVIRSVVFRDSALSNQAYLG